MRYFNKIKSKYYSIIGSKTHKIVVIESDDWGTIRMASKSAFNRLKSSGVNVESNPFNKYDTLESNEDMLHLYELLDRYKDRNGNHPIITSNTIVANPDFERIRQSDFTEYYYELFTDTLTTYPNRNQVKKLVDLGHEKRFFKAQFHGREHVNVKQWMRRLKEGDLNYLKAFEERVFGIEETQKKTIRGNFMAAFDFESSADKMYVNQTIEDGLTIFKKLFGFSSDSIIAPAAVWHSDSEKVMSENGVKYVQGFVIQNMPKIGADEYLKKFHYLGQTNSFNQKYLVRNCYFEPSTNQNFDWVSNCLKQIKMAFLFNKPAIISMHRINFVGGIEEKNRIESLSKFADLLNSIMKNWPDVEFKSSDELGDLIS